MKTNASLHEATWLRTECGKVYSNVFKAVKLVRDEKYHFHVIYRTFSDEYIYSFCNPFQDADTGHVYKLISEQDARTIFLTRLSKDNARELFNLPEEAHRQISF